MRKTMVLALPLMFLSLLTMQASAVITPVEVERVRDVYFARIRGDHHTSSFLFHYVNLSPDDQLIYWGGHIYSPSGLVEAFSRAYWFVSQDTPIDDAVSAEYGYTLVFDLTVYNLETGQCWQSGYDSVVVPPP